MNLSKRHAVKILVCMLAVLMLTTSAFAVTGTVDAKAGLRLRSGAGTNTAILTTLANGTRVEVTGVAENGWYQVIYNGATGFVSNEYLMVSEEDQATLGTVSDPVYGKVTAGPLNVRSIPSTSGSIRKQLSAGTVVQILEDLDGWYKIDSGYICADYVKIIDLSEVGSGKGAEVVAYAMQFLGCRYVYAGSSPVTGFDCSGFTQYVYAHFGINIGHSSSGQLNYGVPVTGELQPGDIVFFKQNTSSSPVSHVGLYIGDGQFIHASSPSTGVIISSMSSHTARGYIGARRLV